MFPLLLCLFLSTINWIVDTRATNHMSYSLDSFKTSYHVSNMYVQLHIGIKLKVSHVRSIQLYPDLVIIDVLFVPKFHFNLFLVSRLTHTKSQCLIFIGE